MPLAAIFAVVMPPIGLPSLYCAFRARHFDRQRAFTKAWRYSSFSLSLVMTCLLLFILILLSVTLNMFVAGGYLWKEDSNTGQADKHSLDHLTTTLDPRRSEKEKEIWYEMIGKTGIMNNKPSPDTNKTVPLAGNDEEQIQKFLKSLYHHLMANNETLPVSQTHSVHPTVAT